MVGAVSIPSIPSLGCKGGSSTSSVRPRLWTDGTQTDSQQPSPIMMLFLYVFMCISAIKSENKQKSDVRRTVFIASIFLEPLCVRAVC